MGDDPTKQSADRQRINIHQSHEVRYWTQALGVSEERLKDVVQKVGPMASDVELELGKERTGGDPGPRDPRKAESGQRTRGLTLVVAAGPSAATLRLLHFLFEARQYLDELSGG